MSLPLQGHTLLRLLSLLHVVVHIVAAEPTLARQSHVDIKMAVRLLHAEVIHSLQAANHRAWSNVNVVAQANRAFMKHVSAASTLDPANLFGALEEAEKVRQSARVRSFQHE